MWWACVCGVCEGRVGWWGSVLGLGSGRVKLSGCPAQGENAAWVVRAALARNDTSGAQLPRWMRGM
jgi:hypothetical protein